MKKLAEKFNTALIKNVANPRSRSHSPRPNIAKRTLPSSSPELSTSGTSGQVESWKIPKRTAKRRKQTATDKIDLTHPNAYETLSETNSVYDSDEMELDRNDEEEALKTKKKNKTTTQQKKPERAPALIIKNTKIKEMRNILIEANSLKENFLLKPVCDNFISLDVKTMEEYLGIKKN